MMGQEQHPSGFKLLGVLLSYDNIKGYYVDNQIINQALLLKVAACDTCEHLYKGRRQP